MITVHHLNNSRSQRILWLLEELAINYKIVSYQRNPTNNLAPDELSKIHPLGKSPVVEDGENVLHESGTIIDFLITKYGEGNLMPTKDSKEYYDYQHWLHYAEGSAMLPLMLKLYVNRLEGAGDPLLPRIHSEIDNHFSYLNQQLADKEYFVGSTLSGADIQLSFPIQLARLLYGLEKFPHLNKFLEKIEARTAYKKAIEKGGPYSFSN